MSHEFTLWHSQALANARQDNNHDLHKALRTYAPQYRYGFEACEQHYQTRIAELEARLAEAEKDAKRHRWLLDNGFFRCNNLHMDGTSTYFVAGTIGRGKSLESVFEQAIESEKV